jgi:cytochrome c553
MRHPTPLTLAAAIGLACALLAPATFAQTAPTNATAQSATGLATRLQDAARDPALQDSLLKVGRKAAAVCAFCHGDGGNSTKSDIPNLAGQNPAYLLEQVHQFGDGRRKNEFMQGMIKALKDDEKLGVVLFYSSQKVLPHTVSPPALVAQGKVYYERICFRCHGVEGRGNETIARIAGQQVDYLSMTLKHYRDGGGQRINPLMAANTKQMTDADIQAVVAYVSSMP